MLFLIFLIILSFVLGFFIPIRQREKDLFNAGSYRPLFVYDDDRDQQLPAGFIAQRFLDFVDDIEDVIP